MTPSPTASLAAGLTEAQRRAICALLPNHAFMASELRSFTTSNSLVGLFSAYPNLVEREKVEWIDGKRNGWAYQYRLTPLGLAVRQALSDRAG